MQFEPFTGSERPAQFEDLWSSPYKPEKDRPLDKALLIIHEGKALYLQHIGPCIDYYLEECSPKEDTFKKPNGVYIWEGTLKAKRTYYPEGDFDIDEELDGTLRPATLEEWQAHINDEHAWDRMLWLIPEEQLPPVI
jgi:hypothetical protein